jgi:hypothetical protein
MLVSRPATFMQLASGIKLFKMLKNVIGSPGTFYLIKQLLSTCLMQTYAEWKAFSLNLVYPVWN